MTLGKLCSSFLELLGILCALVCLYIGVFVHYHIVQLPCAACCCVTYRFVPVLTSIFFWYPVPGTCYFKPTCIFSDLEEGEIPPSVI